MRKIKFRGKVNGQWKYVTPDDHYIWAKFWEVVDRETVGQFTGLLDNTLSDENPIEVYEDDTITYSMSKDGPWREAAIKWEKCEFCMDDEFGLTDSLADIRCLQVIGNIHDNPALLVNQQKKGGP